MFKHIIVPLDGSTLAEKALPYAISLAKRLETNILLMRVTEVKVPHRDTIESELQSIEQAEIYLKNVQRVITNPAFEEQLGPERVQALVAYGDTVEQLVDLAAFEKDSLLVMTTHGRGGFPRLVMGSVAARVLQQSTCPVILVRPEKLREELPLVDIMAIPTPFKSDSKLQLIVALDGTPEAEAVLESVVVLARQLEATLCLLRVAPPIMPVSPNALVAEYGAFYGAEIEEEYKRHRKEANLYLEELQARLSKQGVACIKVVLVGEPTNAIVEYARQFQASMLVMATHAPGKLEQLLIGSIANQVVRESHLPVLMFHTGSPAKDSEESVEMPENVVSN